MATNPIYQGPELSFDVEKKGDETIVHCSGRITSNTNDLLRSTVKPLIAAGAKKIVLDLSNVNYLDSAGLGTIIGLYASAKGAKSQFLLINLNARLKELFSLTRLGEVLTQNRDPDQRGVYYSGL